jgi:hypothetical protein
MKERFKMKETVTEFRTTKEIIEGVVLNSDKFSNFDALRIYSLTDVMLLCVREKAGKDIYEVKTTKKKRDIEGGTRVIADKVSDNKDKTKETYLKFLKKLLGCVFRNVEFHEGNILINDNNNDYVITLVKKKKIEWQ